MPSPFTTFFDDLIAQARTVYQDGFPEDVAGIEFLDHLESAGLKLTSSKTFAKAHFQMANAREEVVKYAGKGLDLFWASKAKLPHPSGLPRILGHHPSLVSVHAGFSVFLELDEEDRSLTLRHAREHSPDRYVSALVRLMAAGSLNAYHALTVFSKDDFALFAEDRYADLLADIIEEAENAPRASALGKASMIEALWLGGQPRLAQKLLNQMTVRDPVNTLSRIESLLRFALMPDVPNGMVKVTALLDTLYGVAPDHELYDVAMTQVVKSIQVDPEKLHKEAVYRARLATEGTGQIGRLRAWLPDYMSHNPAPACNLHGSPLLWTVLALNPLWLADHGDFLDSLADKQFLTASVTFTDVIAWRAMVDAAGESEDKLAWCLSSLDTETILEQELAQTVVDLFIEKAQAGSGILSQLGDPEKTSWERAKKAINQLADKLGVFCDTLDDRGTTTQVFMALGQPSYQATFMARLPRIPELLSQLPGNERERLLGGDLGL